MLRKAGIAMVVVASAAALTTALPAQAAKPVVTGHETATHGMLVRGAHAAGKTARPTRSKQLTAHGGAVQTAPKVYIVFWGTQWGSVADGGTPADTGVAKLQVEFFHHVGVPVTSTGGDPWSASTTQYCQAATGTTFCSPGTITQPGPVFVSTTQDTSPVPTSPTQANIAAVAARAASHFALTHTLDANSQVIVDTPSGHSMSGFKTNWCAWHSSTSSGAVAGGQLSYTYMPYMPDAAGYCGAGFIDMTSASHSALENANNEGVTIVGGHEFAESVTDPFPNSGWLDSSGAENGDKCAWVAASKIVQIDGVGYTTQPLWSNNFNGGAGGCASTYVDSSQQGA